MRPNPELPSQHPNNPRLAMSQVLDCLVGKAKLFRVRQQVARGDGASGSKRGMRSRDLLDLSQEPWIDVRHAMNFVDRHSIPNRLGDGEDSSRRCVAKLADQVIERERVRV